VSGWSGSRLDSKHSVMACKPFLVSMFVQRLSTSAVNNMQFGSRWSAVILCRKSCVFFM